MKEDTFGHHCIYEFISVRKPPVQFRIDLPSG